MTASKKSHLSSLLAVGGKATAGHYVRVSELAGGAYQYTGPFLTEPHAVAFAALAFPNQTMSRGLIEYWTLADIQATVIEETGDRFDLPTDRFIDWASWTTRPDARTVNWLIEDANKLCGE